MARATRRSRFGLPDVFLQEQKQREDELTAETVKNGFTFKPVDGLLEHEGFKGQEFFKNADEGILDFFRIILLKKEENHTMNDSTKRKPPTINKTHFWPLMGPRTAKPFEQWLSLLASTESLGKLAKQVPIILKKEDVFQHLYEHNVSLVRACWYIKMLALYHSANNDSKQKKRHVATDPCTEWTRITIEILKEVFDRLIKENLQSQRTTPIPEISTNHIPEITNDQHSISLNSGSMTPQYAPSTPQMHHTLSSTNISTDKTRRQWDYYNRLLRILFDQGLLDRQTIVEWIVDAFIDRIKHNDDINLRYLIPIIFQFSSEILEYEIFSRKISYYCCKRLGQYHTDITQPINFNNLLSCPQHRIIIYSLSAIIQCITLRCPSALLYNNPIDDPQKSDTLLLNYGSPLDFLPSSPSQLPLPNGIDQQLIKQMLIQSEDEIRLRSHAIEHKWSTEKLQQSISGQTISRVLSVLEILDEFKEEKYLLDNVYNKIYTQTFKFEPLTNDIEIEVIHLMCDWAITTRRHGVYRSFFIARLLERRQNELKTNRLQEINDTIDDKDLNTTINIQINPFQTALMEYLLKKAPFLDDTLINDSDLTQSFSSLVMLFSEFIRLNLFSPMQFMCNLVAHGLVLLNNDNHENNNNNNNNNNTNNSHLITNHNLYKQHVYNTMIRHDTCNIDSNFDRRQTNTLIDLDPLETMNSSPSTTSKNHLRQTSKIELNRNSHQSNEDFNNQQRNRKRCLFYLEQFPYPLDEDFRDDFNQRKIILFGITPKRDEAKRQLKTNVRLLSSLFKLRNCLETTTESPPFTRSTPYAHYLQIRRSILSLSYHDQYYVTNRVSKLLIERLTNFIERRTSRLPWLDDVAFLFELMEKSLNLYGLIQTCVDILRIFSRVETMGSLKSSPGMYSYRFELYLEITSIFRFYTPVLILTPNNMIQVFENLIQITQHIQDPVRTTSVERALLMLMHDSYFSCPYIKSKYMDRVTQIIALIKKELYTQSSQNNKQDTASANCLWDPQAFLNIIEEPRKALTEFQVDREKIYHTKQLDESPQARASFVINTLFAVAKAKSLTYIHDIAHLATELTCQVSSLGSIWLQAIKTLSTCTPSNRSTNTPNHPNVFDELRRIDPNDLCIHDNLSVFISILIARHALSINDYIIVSVQSIIASTPKERLDPLASRSNPSLSRVRGSGGEEANEPGTRFTCDVIEHLFCANHIPWSMMIASRERRLLASNYRLVAFGAFLCVLKSLLIISQSCFKDCKIYYDLCREITQRHKDNDRHENALNMDVNNQAEKEFRPYREPIPEELVDLSMRVLKICCDQDWIQERCLKESDTLCNQTNLCDKLLDDGQAQQLLRFICYKSTSELTKVSFDKGPKPIISSLLQNLNQWTLRATILELKLMIKILEYNVPSPRPQDANFNISLALKTHEHNTQHLLQSIASATIELFQHQTEGRYGSSSSLMQPIEQYDRKGIWLIAPLISRLPDNVQSKILQIAGSVLENGNSMLNSSKSKNDKENQVLRSISLLSHQPFLSLVLSCLKDQDDQRTGLLDSLRGQLEQLYKQECEHCSPPGKSLSNISLTVKPTGSNSGMGSGGSYPDCRCNCHKTDWQIYSNNLAPIVQDDPNMKIIIFESLQLRLSLIGGMFDTIVRNNNSAIEWISVFSQLIASGVIDTKNNSPLLNTVLDMLGVLVHGIVPAEGPIEASRIYMTLVRKIRKDIGERRSEALDEVKRFLPLQKLSFDIYVVEPFDGVNNRMLNPEMKKHGLQVARKEKINSWEMIEGSKSATSICYSWFCAKKTERKRLRYEEQYRLLLRHKHNLFDKSLTYFRDPPVIPPEAPEHPELEIVGENRPSIHNPMSAGPGPYVPMSPIPGSHMHPHTPGMSKPMLSAMGDMSGKQPPPHIGVSSVRATPERKIRGHAPAAASGPTKRTPRMPRSGSTRATAIQAQAPTAPNMYSTQPTSSPHSIYPQPSYPPWPQTVPGPQPSMIPNYPNPAQMKPQHPIQNVRTTGVVPGRPNVQYQNQAIQQPPTSQQQQQPQQQGQPSQMSVGYMTDPTSMMVSSTGANTIPPNANRQPVASGKRKLTEANMYTNEQTQYTTTAKIQIQPTVGSIPQYQQNPVMMQQNAYLQQGQPQQTSHSQMYAQGQMSSGPYMNNAMLGNPANMMPQQTSVYPNMISNQQQNVYNPTAGNPTLNRTPNQTPMSISNQQWSNNQTMNVNRQPQNAYNQMMPSDPQQHYVQQQQQHYQ
ncbi:unnamed protein product [Rotaria sordida]|uniref:Mediator complex subunit Med12 domain-containing protein n=1 Tax=Rotaria sordida TaxID=392033 RepID=A0A814EUV4_9BILA|nr:unnamed protein product [Rotaria sordida]CAF0972878.1 unnamed protein product [Rotaria sordida]CAF0973445.1 unnamed protein product [Rotaria sordida]